MSLNESLETQLKEVNNKIILIEWMIRKFDDEDLLKLLVNELQDQKDFIKKLIAEHCEGGN